MIIHFPVVVLLLMETYIRAVEMREMLKLLMFI
jgi:hypothetical protein